MEDIKEKSADEKIKQLERALDDLTRINDDKSYRINYLEQIIENKDKDIEFYKKILLNLSMKKDI